MNHSFQAHAGWLGVPRGGSHGQSTGMKPPLNSRRNQMKPVFPSLIAASATVRTLAKKARVVGMLVLAVGTPMLMPSAGNAQDARVAKSMAALKDQTAKLGAPKIDGKEAVGGKDAPALYFGSTKMNNNFTVVDEVAKEDGRGMAATLFVKGGDEYIRVATNVPKPDGSGRAIGTVLAGPALESIEMGKPYYGKAPILGVPYVTGYEPIKDLSVRLLRRIQPIRPRRQGRGPACLCEGVARHHRQ
jgi:hypothetical protein